MWQHVTNHLIISNDKGLQCRKTELTTPLWHLLGVETCQWAFAADLVCSWWLSWASSGVSLAPWYLSWYLRANLNTMLANIQWCESLPLLEANYWGWDKESITAGSCSNACNIQMWSTRINQFNGLYTDSAIKLDHATRKLSTRRSTQKIL